jgi:hypothetical protein
MLLLCTVLLIQLLVLIPNEVVVVSNLWHRFVSSQVAHGT